MKGENMKTFLIVGMALFLLLGNFAALPTEGMAQGKKNMDHLCLKILSGTSVTIAGTVVSAGPPGEGIVIDSNGGLLTVYGLGPIWYWEDADVDRPEVGEQISVNGYAVPFPDVTRYIAVSISIGQGEGLESIQLRDSETGCPLWRGGKKK